jgi:hypothetical protein
VVVRREVGWVVVVKVREAVVRVREVEGMVREEGMGRGKVAMVKGDWVKVGEKVRARVGAGLEREGVKMEEGWQGS